MVWINLKYDKDKVHNWLRKYFWLRKIHIAYILFILYNFHRDFVYSITNTLIKGNSRTIGIKNKINEIWSICHRTGLKMKLYRERLSKLIQHWFLFVYLFGIYRPTQDKPRLFLKIGVYISWKEISIILSELLLESSNKRD